MTTEQHARILYAYLSRLTPAEIDAILTAEKEAWHASINLGLSSQLAAHEKSMLAIQTAIGRMMDYDKNNIQRIIETTL